LSDYFDGFLYFQRYEHLRSITKTFRFSQVVRCAEHGALVLGRAVPAAWVPAYWNNVIGCNSSLDPLPSSEQRQQPIPSRHPQVVDTTGAGNCFLGGFAVGLLETGDPVKAAHYGAVAASFVVQQLGLPKLEVRNCGADGSCGGAGDACPCRCGGQHTELWNGESVRERLERQMELQMELQGERVAI
jgi:hypothetical protein